MARLKPDQRRALRLLAGTPHGRPRARWARDQPETVHAEKRSISE
jgi:hypothetical protein